MMEPKWHTLADFLIERFPELKSEIEDSYFFWCDAGGNPYPHVFLEEFLLPILLGRENNATSETCRQEAGLVMDQLLVSSDEDLASAALTSVLEVLRDNGDLFLEASPFLGVTARTWLERLAAEQANRGGPSRT